MAYTQADLDALRKAKATGAIRVELPSVGTITYRTLEEFRQIESEMLDDINAAAGKKPVRQLRIRSAKGL